MDDQKNRNERYDKALKYVDKLLPILPEVAHFVSSEIVLNSNWSEQEKKEADTVFNYIDKTLIKFEYVTEHGYWFELTDKGRAAKKADGHFAYLKQLDDKAEAEKVRQAKKDNSDEIDLKIKQWTYKARYTPYIFSTLALLGTIVSISISIKALNYKKEQPNLNPTQQQLQQLKPQMNKQDSLFRSDTLRTKPNK